MDFILSRETIHLVQPVARFLATPDEERLLGGLRFLGSTGPAESHE